MGARILVTGAASGIGAALCRILEARGDAPLGLDRGAPYAAVDLADASAIAAFAAAAPPLDGVAHVAGLPGTQDPETILRVNFLAPRLLTQALAPKLSPGASIVVVSSIAAHRCPWPADALDQAALAAPAEALALAMAGGPGGNDAYELSKRLLLAWVPHAAAALAGQGVRVNAVSPGPVRTPILADFYQAIGAARMEAAAQIVGRHAEPEEIAEVAAFLLSGASRWVNGVEIKADGGLHALRAAGQSQSAKPAA